MHNTGLCFGGNGPNSMQLGIASVNRRMSIWPKARQGAAHRSYLYLLAARVIRFY